METKGVIIELRKHHNLSQDEMAERLFVTRQAVSRWETGETVPNTETLKLISKEFGIHRCSFRRAAYAVSKLWHDIVQR